MPRLRFAFAPVAVAFPSFSASEPEDRRRMAPPFVSSSRRLVAFAASPPAEPRFLVLPACLPAIGFGVRLETSLFLSSARLRLVRATIDLGRVRL
eukprot:CAMPEP_0171328236 /NCGR_PEP_ID=MMETSP0878-20121228/533_1 /TAXON_ID=67004 /ORGANISM="Thalassiosira weissflogii, Strain CCMP1336" /LENGTH=94 /DNA_ID=CAMNT_0011828071 /DNA_START=335 /DNA_END=620 /DNA_ORIENTATION=-